jgi:glycosyltransferase involved in cell wall biosynthesis
MSVKVVHIITRMILGGAQENTLLTCEGLHRSPEWDVTLVTGPAIGPEGELIHRALRGGIRTIVVPEMRRVIHPSRDSVSLARLLQIIRHLRPDVVHTHSSKAGILGRLAAKMARVPVVIHTIHGLPFHPFQGAAANALCIGAERLAARWSDRLVCVADAMARQALAAGVGTPEQYLTIYSGIEVEPFLRAEQYRRQVRNQFGFSDEDVVIGKVARLFNLKGHEYVIAAAPQIVRRCGRAKFLFVGDGTLRDQLVRQAERLGVADRIVFAGLVDSSRIPAMISAMDVVVHASLREGLARVLVQALLAARPVVSYDVDGAPEVIIGGVTGRLVPPRSVTELADALADLIEHPDKAAQMAQEGRRRFTQPFRAETMVTRLEHLYRQLLGERGTLAPSRA